MTGRTFRKLASEDIRMVKTICGDIRIASSLGDKEVVDSAFQLLFESIDGSIELIESFFGKPQVSIGMREPQRDWMNDDPPETLENLRMTVSVNEITMKTYERDASLAEDELQARTFDSRRIRLIRLTSFTVQMGRCEIRKKEPAFWTKELDLEFKAYLNPPIFQQ